MNPFRKFIAPRLPSAAVGLSSDGASVVQLERRRGDVLTVRRAAYAELPEGLVRPSFDERNIADPSELAARLAELVTDAGLLKRNRWSVALPEAATRTTILTLESASASRQEREEMIRWKIERAIGTPLDDLRVSRERLRPDPQGRARFLVAAMRLTTLDEYEQVFESLGWNAGLILPRHMGEAWWLMRGGAKGRAIDSLLISSHREGFTAAVLRDGQPILLRSVVCEAEDRADELYRFLLFYRDRNAPAAGGATSPLDADAAERFYESEDAIEQMLIAGTGLSPEQADEIIRETLSAPPRLLGPGDVRISYPANELDFNLIAAPAGLAALAWS